MTRIVPIVSGGNAGLLNAYTISNVKTSTMQLPSVPGGLPIRLSLFGQTGM